MKDKQRPALHSASRSCSTQRMRRLGAGSRPQCGQQSSCLVKMTGNKTCQKGNGCKLCPLLLLKGLSPSCTWVLQPAMAWIGAPQHPGMLPPSTVTPTPLPQACLLS